MRRFGDHVAGHGRTVPPFGSGLRTAAIGLPAIPDWPTDSRRLLDASDDRLAPLAASLGLPLEALVFLTRELVAAVLRQAASTLSPLVEDALWQRPSCPVCGGAPDCGMLKEKTEQSEFLIAKAGDSACIVPCAAMSGGFPVSSARSAAKRTTTNARFSWPRPGRERIHTCSTCGRYLLVLDMVDSGMACDVD